MTEIPSPPHPPSTLHRATTESRFTTARRTPRFNPQAAITAVVPTSEERAIADANVEVAVAAVAVVAARVAKLRIRAPSDGAVALLVAEPSEAIIPGQPVMTLQTPGQRWASFNMREDQIDDLRIGSRVELTPADGSAPNDARIDEIIPRDEFATWRAARAVGGPDLNTFVLRADPVGVASEALQSGMSVSLKPASNAMR